MFFRKRYRSKICYASEAIYLDTETSNNHVSDPRKLRTWITSIQVRFDKQYYLFRKPTELTDWLNSLIKKYDLNPEKKIMIFIHNAAYDLSYLVPWLQQELPAEPRRGIYEGSSKIIMYEQFCFEFRCSYMLTGASLAKWSEDLNVEHKKQVGLYDYDKIIYQDDELTEDEQAYDMYDVLSLEECLKKQLLKYDDDLPTVPMTSTGYCRRIFRKGARTDPYYKKQIFLESRLDVEAYKFCVNAFAGGFTHTNRYLKSLLLIFLMGHKDFRSMYPSILRCYLLPFGNPEVWFDASSKHYQDRPFKPTTDDIINMYPEYFSVVKVRIYAAELRSLDITMPFMQYSKMKHTDNVNFIYLNDNGRVMKIIKKDPDYKGAAAEMYLDCLTLKILKEQYKMQLKILKVIRFKNMPLPDCLADTIDELFRKKSELKLHYLEMKEKFGEFSEQAIEAEYEMNRVKKLLNATYGMFATNPCRPEYDLDYEAYFEGDSPEPLKLIKSVKEDEDIEASLDKFYSARSSFLPYQVGLAVTATARYELYEYIKAVGYENCIYCDTDSIFYKKTDEVEKRIEKLNKEKHKTAKYVTVNNERIYYDVFESEKDITHFKSLHSKCYGYINTKGELKLTIAGIPARTIIGMKDGSPVYLTREEELAGITKEQKLADPDIEIQDKEKVLDLLSHHSRFTVNTGTSAYYIVEKPHVENINGHMTELAGGCVISKLTEKYIKDIDIGNFEIDVDFQEREE